MYKIENFSDERCIDYLEEEMKFTDGDLRKEYEYAISRIRRAAELDRRIEDATRALCILIEHLDAHDADDEDAHLMAVDVYNVVIGLTAQERK